ncbi:peptide ABC transporter substrate-binding protein [Clostridium omnivorum]|uniref:Peptide ABC transporter substrate-binding protein n=1 Tax=Clostridium omnivorum TaxID=1604902 RepID=A0ABQ5N0K3_9CLOT|nr:peptide ABC transporter substrate-binding protein [Clostridium sp. E14]GLC28730.1 peptide ABC transporter substrate-binding protein [Clostridium sp. E14]
MNSKKIMATVLATAVVATTVLAGCGKKAASDTSKTEIDKDQYVNAFLKAEPQTLDISKAKDLYSSQILQEVTEGLTRLEKDDKGKEVTKPAGAESWTKSDDGLTWTFKIRDMKWSDGKAVSAKDYEYSIKRTLDPKTAAQYAFFLYPIKGAQEYNSAKDDAKAAALKDAVGVKATDDKTLVITLAKPTAYFLDTTNFKVYLPQRQDVVEKAGDKYGTEANTLVFNGPFKIKEWVHQNKFTLEKNADYWDAKNVKLNTVNFKIIKDEEARMKELYNGSTDIGGVRKTEWMQKYDQAGKFTKLEGFDGSSVYQFYNTKPEYNGQKNIFSNVKVRQAFSLALNREDIVKTLYKGLGKPAYGWVPNEILIGGEEFRSKVEEPIKKLADANKDPKALFIEGLKELGLGDDPSKISVEYLSSGTDAQSKEISEYYQQTYQKALGIKMTIKYVEWNIFQNMTDKMEYQLGGMAWGADYNDPMTFMDMWMTGANMVPTGWESKDYDAFIEKASNSIDPKVRTQAFADAEKFFLVDQSVITPVIYRKYAYYEYKYVKNAMFVNFGQLQEFKYAYTQGRPAK